MTGHMMMDGRRIAAALLLGGIFMFNLLPVQAQGADFERTVRDCMDNGFSRDECLSHAEKVHNVERSSEDRYLEERRQRLEEQSRPAPKKLHHPGRRNINRP
ncbi:MAG: hypothetical protein ACKVHL_07050 [Rhodospirillales bacterium]